MKPAAVVFIRLLPCLCSREEIPLKVTAPEWSRGVELHRDTTVFRLITSNSSMTRNSQPSVFHFILNKNIFFFQHKLRGTGNHWWRLESSQPLSSNQTAGYMKIRSLNFLVTHWLVSAFGNVTTDVCSCVHWDNCRSHALSSGALCCSLATVTTETNISHNSPVFSLTLCLLLFSLSSHDPPSPNPPIPQPSPTIYFHYSQYLLLSEWDAMSASL